MGRVRPLRFQLRLSAFFVAAVGAWAAVVLLERGPAMGMTATMGLPPIAFLGAWALMTAAMMLPAVAPVASLYMGTFEVAHGRRLAVFALGYLLVWTLLGIPAYLVALAVDALVGAGLERWLLVAVLLALAAYQLTPLKAFCLNRCRSPLSQFLGYAAYRGAARDLRVGAHHGLYCSGCCWPLMLLLVAVGTMNLWAMLLLTAVVAAEKLLPWGKLVTGSIAAAALAAAVPLAVLPALAPLVLGR